MRWPGTSRKIEELVEAHYASLFRFAYRLTGKTQEAEDLTQEAFCQAQGNWDQLRDHQRARAWLFAILRNAYLRDLRDRKTQNARSLEEVGELPERPAEAPPEIDPVQLQEALDELPEPFRTPIILFYFGAFSYRAIADQLSVPLGTVMSRLARARSFLKRRLAESSGLIAGGTAKEKA